MEFTVDKHEQTYVNTKNGIYICIYIILCKTIFYLEYLSIKRSRAKQMYYSLRFSYVLLKTAFSISLFHNVFHTTSFSECLSHNVFLTTSFAHIVVFTFSSIQRGPHNAST